MPLEVGRDDHLHMFYDTVIPIGVRLKCDISPIKNQVVANQRWRQLTRPVGELSSAIRGILATDSEIELAETAVIESRDRDMENRGLRVELSTQLIETEVVLCLNGSTIAKFQSKPLDKTS